MLSPYHFIYSRHPIQEMCVDVFIANDAHLVGGLGNAGSEVTTTHIENSAQHNEDEAASIALLTGANYSGKSVYLRQVCILYGTMAITHAKNRI